MSTAIEVDELRENRLRWLEALESDEWSQTTGKLLDKDFDYDPEVGDDVPVEGSESFCCLGVARELLNPGWWLTHDVEVDEPDYVVVRARYQMKLTLTNHLIEMNDQRNRDFRFIARFLRKVWGLTGVA